MIDMVKWDLSRKIRQAEKQEKSDLFSDTQFYSIRARGAPRLRFSVGVTRPFTMSITKNFIERNKTA